MSGTYQDYARYVASGEFKARSRTLLMQRPTCERCRCCPSTDAAHLSYKNLGAEQPGDLAALCRACHQYIDGVTDEDHARKRRADLTISTDDEYTWVQRVCLLGYSLGQASAAGGDTEVWLEHRSEGAVLLGTLNLGRTALKHAPWLRIAEQDFAPKWDEGRELRRNRPLHAGTCPDCSKRTWLPYEPSNGYGQCYRCYTGKEGEYAGVKPTKPAPLMMSAPKKLVDLVPGDLRRDLGSASAEDIARMLGSKAPVIPRANPPRCSCPNCMERAAARREP